MPAPTFTPGDEKQDDLNPGQRDYDRRFSDLSSAEQQGTINMDDFERNYQENADSTQENKNIDAAANALRSQETEGSSLKGQWQNNTTGKSKEKGKAWFKRKGAWFGIGGGGVGIAALLGLGGLAPAFLLPNIMQNATSTNDVRSGILEQRVVQRLAKIMGANVDTTCSAVARCNAGKMPKSMLSALEEKGIRPVNADGSAYTDSSRGKYVNINPSNYAIDDGKGGTRIISKTEFIDEYKKNPSFRKSVKGAKNMMFFGYNGKYMLKNFFKPYGLKRDGGLANDSELTKDNVGAKIDEKLKPPLGENDAEGAKNKFKSRLTALLKKIGVKLSKVGGDPALAVGLGACTLAGLPQFASGTIRAIQAAQLGVLLMDVVLSPAGAQQASEIDGAKLAAIGGMLTERVDGKTALDSPVLQSAIGVNKNPVTVSTNYAPGYMLLSNPAIQSANQINASMKPGCDLINTPQAAVASASIYAAITAASGGTGAPIIAALKAGAAVLVGIGAIQGIITLAEESGLLGAVAEEAYKLILPLIPQIADGARGQDLGDALGSAMYTFYPQAGLAGGAAVLTTDQVKDTSDQLSTLVNERREEDIATLSPFDTSSQYTFMGSIMANLSLHSVQGNPVLSALSITGSLFSSPFSMFSSKASAAELTTTNCSYASQFGIDSSIAINAAGYPCVGIPSQYMNMSVDEVYDLVGDQIDPETGEPKEDSDIMLMMADCSEGDLESVTGCTIKGTPAVNANENVCTTIDGEEDCTNLSINADAVSDKQRAAQSLYLFDMQVDDILTGDDDETAYSDTSSMLAFYDKASIDESIDSLLASYGSLSAQQSTIASSVLLFTDSLGDSLHSFKESIKNSISTQSINTPGVISKFANPVIPRSAYWTMVGV